MIYSEKSEFLQTPRGQYGRYMSRLLKGRSYYSFDVEPKSKKSMKKHEKIKFQQDLLKKIKNAKRRAYRAPIVAELNFDVIGNTPPFIHTVVKNYQDLFEKPLDKSIKRKGLIYQNDKSIYGLSVRYNLKNDKPAIRASFMPFRDFLQNLDLANDILSGDSENIWKEQHIEHQNSHDAFGDLEKFIKKKNEFIEAVGEEAYQSLLLSYRMAAQEDLLSGFSLGLRDLYFFYMPLIMIQKFGKNHLSSNRNDSLIPDHISKSIVNSPIRIQLPNIPTRKNEKILFKKRIQSSLNDFYQKHPIFRPLHIPVHLNILYKPPKASKHFFKDLDNILRMIVPIFNDIFEPPSTYGSIVKVDRIKYPRLYNSFKKLEDDVPKSIRTSISGYDIFQMPRYLDDISEGYLTASFSCSISNNRSLMSKSGDLIEEWYESFEI